MATVAKSRRTGELDLLDGELNERLPVIRDGLVYHFPFDGNTKAVYNIAEAHLNILSYNSHTTTWQMRALISNGSIATGTVTVNDSASEATALTYDLVVTDMYVWAVSTAVMNTLKTYADAGCVIWATGNDTVGGNNLILTNAAIGAETTYHGHIYGIPEDIETYLGLGTALSQVNNTSNDPGQYLATLHEDCIPLYWHDFVGENGIMGFLYLPKNGNGGSIYFDEFGIIFADSTNQVWMRHLLQWQLNRKQVSSLITTDDDVTHRFRGATVESATTNIITSSHPYFPNFRPYSGLAHSNGSVIVTDEVPPAIEGIDIYRITDNALDTQNMRYSLKFNIVDDDIWDVDVTYSIYIWFPEKFKDRYLNFSYNMYQNTTGIDWHGTQGWNTTHSYWGAGGIMSDQRLPDLSKTNCWQKYSITGKALVANRYNKFGDAGTGDPDNKYIAGYLRVNVTEGQSTDNQPSPFFFYITAPQLEEKAYHTEFVDGSRSGDGDLIISGLDIDTSAEDFTLNFKIDTNGQIAASGGDKILLNNFGYFWRYHPTSTDSGDRRWIWDWVVTGTRNFQDLIDSVLFDTGFETITITYSHDTGTYGQVTIYRNGEYWATDNGTVDCTLGTIDLIQIVDLGATVRDVSLFNKVLSTDQIYELANSGMSIGPNGLITDEVREYPDIPSTYYMRYFPLGDHAQDKNKIISPSTENNLIFRNRCVWIGQSTTNSSSPGMYSDWSNSGSHETFSDNRINRLFDVPVKGYRQLTDGSTGFSFGEAVSVVSTVYSASVYMWIDVNGVETNIPYFREYYTGSNHNLGNLLYKGVATSWQDLPQRQWIRLEVENKTTRSDSLTLHISGYITKAGTTVYMTASQIEEKPFVSPYTDPPSRNDSNLYYANTILTQEHGAICGWFLFNENARAWRGPGNNNDFSMLFSTYGASEVNKLNLRSHYSYAANRWYVQTSNSTPSLTSTYHTIPDGWHFICLAWDDSTGYRKFFVDAEKKEDIPAYLPDAYDSDLRIGNWYTGDWGSMNQYVRDLIILDFYPDDDEVFDIYRKTMSAYKDHLRVNYEIREVE